MKYVHRSRSKVVYAFATLPLLLSVLLLAPAQATQRMVLGEELTNTW